MQYLCQFDGGLKVVETQVIGLRSVRVRLEIPGNQTRVGYGNKLVRVRK